MEILRFFGQILQTIFGVTLPEQAAEGAHLVDDLYNAIMLLSVIGFFGFVAVMVFFIIRYHKTQNDKSAYIPHNALAETIWTVVPTIIFVGIAVWGIWAFQEKDRAPADSMTIKVTGKQWFWEFKYLSPEDGLDFTTTEVMYVPIGKTVVTDMTATDVLHSFYIPSFRVKKDTVPGMRSSVVFKATKEGDFPIFCTEYCGTSHSRMTATVRVVSQERFDKWMNYQLEQVRFLKTASPAERGAKLVVGKGCTSCHGLTDKVVIGPSFKGLWGKERKFIDGSSLTADAEYIRESILMPQAKIVEGFAGVKMNSFQGQVTEEEIDDIIEYIKTVN
jgi:cytochrome c oxidase subunit 2